MQSIHVFKQANVHTSECARPRGLNTKQWKIIILFLLQFFIFRIFLLLLFFCCSVVCPQTFNRINLCKTINPFRLSTFLTQYCTHSKQRAPLCAFRLFPLNANEINMKKKNTHTTTTNSSEHFRAFLRIRLFSYSRLIRTHRPTNFTDDVKKKYNNIYAR